MSTCYLIKLASRDGEFEYSFVSHDFPSYRTLVCRMPIEGKRLLAQCKVSMKFELSLAQHFSTPLFKNDPTGKEKWKDSFDHMKNLLGRLCITPLKFFPS